MTETESIPYLKTLRGGLKVAIIIIGSIVFICSWYGYFNTFCHSSTPLLYSEIKDVLKLCVDGYEGHREGWWMVMWCLVTLLLLLLSGLDLRARLKASAVFTKSQRLKEIIFHFTAAVAYLVFTSMGVAPFLDVLNSIQRSLFICPFLTEWWYVTCTAPKATPISLAGILGYINALLYGITGILEVLNKY